MNAYPPTVRTGPAPKKPGKEIEMDAALRALRSIRSRIDNEAMLTVAVGDRVILFDAKWGNQGRTIAFNIDHPLTDLAACDSMLRFIDEVNAELAGDDLK